MRPWGTPPCQVIYSWRRHALTRRGISDHGQKSRQHSMARFVPHKKRCEMAAVSSRPQWFNGSNAIMCYAIWMVMKWACWFQLTLANIGVHNICHHYVDIQPFVSYASFTLNRIERFEIPLLVLVLWLTRVCFCPSLSDCVVLSGPFY